MNGRAQMSKYIVGIEQHILVVDDDTVVVKTHGTQSRIKGPGMAVAFREIYDRFQTPRHCDEVVNALSNKYSAPSLHKMIQMLKDKHILISEDEHTALLAHGDGFLAKNLYLNSSGQPLDTIVQKMKHTKIGIIGTEPLTDELNEVIVKSELVCAIHTAN